MDGYPGCVPVKVRQFRVVIHRRASMLLIASFMFCLIQHAQASGGSVPTVHVVGLDVSGLPGQDRQIRIRTDQTPVYTLFRLFEPSRLVIDIAGADITALRGPIRVEDGLIKQVGLFQYSGDHAPVGRIIVGLADDADYLATLQGDTIVVHTSHSQVASSKPPELQSVATAQPQGRAAGASAAALDATPKLQDTSGATLPADSSDNSTAKRTQISQAPLAAAPSSEKDRSVARSAAKGQSPSSIHPSEPEDVQPTAPRLLGLQTEQDAVFITLSSPVRMSTETLQGPDRLVVDLARVSARRGTLSLRDRPSWLRRVRVGRKPHGMRLVFDLKAGELADAQPAKGGIWVRAVSRPKASAPTAQAPTSVLRDVNFISQSKGRGQRAHVVLSTLGHAVPKIDTSNPGTWVLELAGVSLPPALERSLDTRAFGGVVSLVSTYQVERAPPKVHIVVSLTGPAKQKLVKSRDGWLWQIDNQTEQILASVAKDRVAGFVADAPPAQSSSTQPQQSPSQVEDSSKQQLSSAAIDTDPVPQNTNPSPTGDQQLNLVTEKTEGASEPVSTPQSLLNLSQGGASTNQGLGPLSHNALDPQGHERTRDNNPLHRRRISLDVKDADIINVLRLISEETGENIIASDEVHGKVTLKLRNVPADQALDTMLRTKGFDRVRHNNILRIASAEAIQKERDLDLARRRALVEVEDTIIKMVTVNYATASEVVAQLKPMLSGRGTVQVDARTNTLIVQDIASNIDRLVELARRLDKQTPLVNIQARIVEAASTHIRDLGVQWGGASQHSARTGNPTGLYFPHDVVVSGAADNGTANQTAGTMTPARYAVNLPATLGGAGGGLGFILGSAGGSQLLDLRLTAMETNGNGKIISSPEVSTLDNRMARVSQGVEIPISTVSAAGTNTRFIPAVLELEVTPHVTNDGTVLLKIRVQKSQPDFSNRGAAGDPTIQKKQAETEVLVRDGDTSVIGGIYTRDTSNSYNEVPFLARIPLLGSLFREKRVQDNRSELLVFITPRIINRDESVVQSGSLLEGTRD